MNNVLVDSQYENQKFYANVISSYSQLNDAFIFVTNNKILNNVMVEDKSKFKRNTLISCDMIVCQDCMILDSWVREVIDCASAKGCEIFYAGV